jgi:pSer/pThr/pTyr-binding forkhead associated (FHA) protein
MPVIYIHRQSAYLIGRDRKIADFPVDHPSCSKQHAAIQYRSMPYERLDGTRGRVRHRNYKDNHISIFLFLEDEAIHY